MVDITSMVYKPNPHELVRYNYELPIVKPLFSGNLAILGAHPVPLMLLRSWLDTASKNALHGISHSYTISGRSHQLNVPERYFWVRLDMGHTVPQTALSIRNMMISHQIWGYPIFRQTYTEMMIHDIFCGYICGCPNLLHSKQITKPNKNHIHTFLLRITMHITVPSMWNKDK
jgi:hypothetical protein